MCARGGGGGGSRGGESKQGLLWEEEFRNSGLVAIHQLMGYEEEEEVEEEEAGQVGSIPPQKGGGGGRLFEQAPPWPKVERREERRREERSESRVNNGWLFMCMYTVRIERKKATKMSKKTYPNFSLFLLPLVHAKRRGLSERREGRAPRWRPTEQKKGEGDGSQHAIFISSLRPLIRWLPLTDGGGGIPSFPPPPPLYLAQYSTVT